MIVHRLALMQLLGATARIAPLVAATLGGCVFDPDDRCGENQTFVEVDAVCACNEGFVLDAATAECVRCAENEEVVSGTCVCSPGFSRAVEGGPCTAVPEALGVRCNPSDATPCGDATYDFCQPAGAEGYCTSTGCASDDDCGPGYACDAAVSPPVCLRPPSGQGKSCETMEDCADGEADYCETIMVKLCLVDGCVEDGGRCHGAYSCCDFSDLMSGLSICVPPENMEDEACPFGATLVEERN